MCVFRIRFFLWLSFLSSVDSLIWGGSHSSRSIRGGTTEKNERKKNITTEQYLQNRLTNCTPPATFTQLIPTDTQANLTLSLVSSSYALYGTDDGHEINLFAYDCTTETEMVFVHIPKNAGSTIEDLALRNGIQWGQFLLSGDQQMPGGRTCSKWHVPPDLLAEYPNPYANPKAEVFCVTRDPWERILSDYIYLLSVEYKWAPFGHIHDGPSCTAAGLNAFVEHNLAYIQAGDLSYRFSCDCHLLPQWDFIEGPDGHQWCSHLLPLEDLTSSFNALMSEHGIPFRLTPYDKSNSAKGYCPELSEQADVDLNGVFSESAKSAMREVYAKDFAHLGDSLH